MRGPSTRLRLAVESGRPKIVAVGPEVSALSVITRNLRTRYGADYEIHALPPEKGIRFGMEVPTAVVLADVMWSEAEAFLADVRDTSPTTKRLVYGSWGMPVSASPLQEVLRNGLAEYFVIVPQVEPDEQFHRVISESLEEWSRSNGTLFELVKLIDKGPTPKMHRLSDLLQRNYVTYGVYDPSGAEGRALMEKHGLADAQLPAAILFDDRVLVDPSERDLADALTGETGTSPQPVDVAIVGGGPAGLAAAVYAASEGLSVAVLEREAIGGQAGTTSLIRNYLGFNRGVSGQELAFRAFRQAWAFGVEVRFIREATSLKMIRGGFNISISDGGTLTARSVILAQGVTYRRIGVEELEALVGAGVYYGAAVTEAPLTRGRSVYVVGGGNSAGQAAVHLSKFAAKVTLLVRGSSLASSMSDYLITDLQRIPNLTIAFDCEVSGGGGATRLEWIEIINRKTQQIDRAATDGLFVLIGAVPATAWLPAEIMRDQWGYVLTGQAAAKQDDWPLERQPYQYETSVPGVFAVGDVRGGSVKRVASAVGEGSVTIQAVHRFLTEDQGRKVAPREPNH